MLSLSSFQNMQCNSRLRLRRILAQGKHATDMHGFSAEQSCSRGLLKQHTEYLVELLDLILAQ